MSLDPGNGGSPLDAVGSIDTRIFGNPETIRAKADEVYKLYKALSDAYIEMTNSLVPNPEYWGGETANAYYYFLNAFRASTSTNADYAYHLWQVMRAYAQQLDYHYRDMETIRTDAERCGLEIEFDYFITALPTPGPEPKLPP